MICESLEIKLNRNKYNFSLNYDIMLCKHTKLKHTNSNNCPKNIAIFI